MAFTGDSGYYYFAGAPSSGQSYQIVSPWAQFYVALEEWITGSTLYQASHLAGSITGSSYSASSTYYPTTQAVYNYGQTLHPQLVYVSGSTSTSTAITICNGTIVAVSASTAATSFSLTVANFYKYYMASIGAYKPSDSALTTTAMATTLFHYLLGAQYVKITNGSGSRSFTKKIFSSIYSVSGSGYGQSIFSFRLNDSTSSSYYLNVNGDTVTVYG